MSRCRECWRQAQSLHQGGQGEGDSVTQVYHRLVDAYWCRTTEGRRVVEARRKEDVAERTPGAQEGE